MDSTLLGVIVGGLLASVPAILAARISADAQIHLASDADVREARRERRAAYEAFLDHVHFHELQGRIASNALATYRDSHSMPIGDPRIGAAWDARFLALIIRMELYGSAPVLDASNKLYSAFHKEIARVVATLDTKYPSPAADDVIATLAMDTTDEGRIEKWYDSVTSAMRHDVQPVPPTSGVSGILRRFASRLESLRK